MIDTTITLYKDPTGKVEVLYIGPDAVQANKAYIACMKQGESLWLKVQHRRAWVERSKKITATEATKHAPTAPPVKAPKATKASKPAAQ